MATHSASRGSAHSPIVGVGAFRYGVDQSWPHFPANGPDGEAVAVACDAQDRVYVFLRGSRPVQVFEPDGTLIATWGEGRFNRPHGIFIGRPPRPSPQPAADAAQAHNNMPPYITVYMWKRTA